MPRWLSGLLLGAGAGGIATVSHALAGGHVDASRSALLVAGAAVCCAALFSLRLPAVRRFLPAASLIGVQLLAHPWLEAGHAGHAHASTDMGGMLQHALTPGMVMFGAHLVGLAAVLVVAQMGASLLHAWARGLPRIGWSAPGVALLTPSDRPWIRGSVRVCRIRVRGPPLTV